MKRIETTDTLSSTADLTFEWKIAATRASLGWDWCGSLAMEAVKFTKSMYWTEEEPPTISCVTGRDPSGREVLYARLYPQHLMRKTVPATPSMLRRW